MFTPVTIKQTAKAHYVPSFTGFGGEVYQPSITIVTTHTGAEIRVIDTASEHVASAGTDGVRITDIGDEVPAELTEHDEIAQYWHAKAQRWAREAEAVLAEA